MERQTGPCKPVPENGSQHRVHADGVTRDDNAKGVAQQNPIEIPSS
jgi:hypothetical protein